MKINAVKIFLSLIVIGITSHVASAQTWIVTNPPPTIFTTNLLAEDANLDLTPRVDTGVGIPDAKDYTSGQIQIFLRKREGFVIDVYSPCFIGGKLIVTYNVRGLAPSLVEAKIPAKEAYKLSENSPVRLGVGYYRGLSYQKGKVGVQKKWITGFASEDNKRIVLVPDKGSIRFSEDYGMTWKYINMPGRYQFTLAKTEKGSAIVAEVTLTDSVLAMNETANAKDENWYSTLQAADNTRLVVTADPSQPVPVLQIKQSAANVIVSWPSEFTNFNLQQSSDMETWEDITNSVDTFGETNLVSLPSATGSHFFRLKAKLQ